APGSHTAAILRDVLARGPHAPRHRYDRFADSQPREGDLELSDVGRDAKMPWEVDGRRWHTQDRVGRDGSPCRWDGRILERVVDCVQQTGSFSPTDWSNRGVVEIAAERKTDGWFLHALTGENWLLKLKFRVARGAFQEDTLVEQLGLKTLNQMDHLPIYGNEPRVKCRSVDSHWREVQINAHSLEELDKPAFWQFVESAVESFQTAIEHVAANPEDVMPWKVLGKKWHLLRRGFPPNRPIAWPVELLEKLVALLGEVAPEGEYQWTSQQVVHLLVSPQREPWATIQTKRPDAVHLTLAGPKGRVALGRIAQLGTQPDLDTRGPNRDLVKLSFVRPGDLEQGDLREFLREHLAALKESS
ncbi:MAG: excinuclease ABC subunit A, partial [Pirellulaceae bacterium]|nr:excinuclease ABC subunit A [Pirellulaceae bacterium]